MKISRSRVGVSALVSILCILSNAFGQADVARRSLAITYPLDEEIRVQFRGTTRFPRMKGEAKVKRSTRSGTKIDISVERMPRPFELGAGYATYVIWAISPDGQIDRLGEIKRRGLLWFDSKMTVTTPLQTFALLITAEPHFLVTRPSQEIMLENLSAYRIDGSAVQTTAAVHYFGNSSDYFKDSRTPEIAERDYARTPSSILQGYQAIALARFAGAERDAPDELRHAEDLLQTAEASWKAGRDEETVDIAARNAISAAVKAEGTAIERRVAREKRNEQTRADAEMRKLEDDLADARQEIDDLKAQLASETRNRELSERDVSVYTQQIRDLRAENGRLREELGRMKVEFDNAKARIEAYDVERQTAEQQREREQRLAAIAANEPGLMQSLRRYGTVAKTDRGIVLTLPENFWSAPRAATFAPAADPKITSLGEILANNPSYKITIESHTDNRGEPEELEALTRQRSQAIAERLSAFGIEQGRLEARGLGASLPIAPNTTNVNRAKNRRVQIIISPSI